MVLRFTITCFLFLVCSVGLIFGECPADSHRHKTIRLGIFYTEHFLKEWSDKGGSGSSTKDVLPYLKKLTTELTTLFSANHFGNNSVKFTVDLKDVMQIPSSDLMQYMTGYLHYSAVGYCKLAHLIREEKNQTWDINFVFVTKREKRGARAAGVVAQMQSYCSSNKLNCGIMTIAKNSRYVANFGIYPKLFAHEIGHSLGLPHDYECNEPPCEPRGMTIMNSPGSNQSDWSSWSKRIINRLFKDKKTYTCLKWKCGAYKIEKDNIFSNKEDTKIMNKFCYDGFGIPRYPFKLDDMMTDQAYKSFIAGYTMKRTSYYKILKANPQWYMYKNICKGLPCKALTAWGSTVTYAWAQHTLHHKPCGKEKICINGNCVDKDYSQ